MTLDTYESMVASGCFLTVPAGRDPERLRLPAGREWDNLVLVHGGYVLGPPAADSEVFRRIKRDIETRGYAIHEIDLTAFQSPRG